MIPLLSVRDIVKTFGTKGKGGDVRAVNHVSLDVQPGQTLGVVGESGSGKSTLGRLMLRLLEPTSGSIIFNGTTLSDLGTKDVRRHRRQMQMIFQDPLASLDPRMSVRKLITEPLIIHRIGDKQEQSAKVHDIMDRVGLSIDALDRFPHEFSGGQRQRISIARAIITMPQLIIADEPVSSLDVSIQSQILNLLLDLRRDLNLTYVFISHDLAVVQHLADTVAVMHLGEVVEMASASEIFNNPKHPYTQALISAVPQIDLDLRRERIVLRGDIPNPQKPPTGCHFHPRCPQAMSICSQEAPTPLLLEVPGVALGVHTVTCHLYTPGREE